MAADLTGSGAELASPSTAGAQAPLVRPASASESARTACLIGAGPSGLVAAKILAERGIPFHGYEMGSDIGGLWRYENDTGRSPAYASLHTNTSRKRTGYACFPPPRDWPDYPHHSDLLRYLEDFADHFGLRERFAFRSRVVQVTPVTAEGGHLGSAGHDVTIRDLATAEERIGRYGTVLVATGHHWDPVMPELPGRLDGPVLHSREYRTPDLLEGRRVLVVGIGNSACDIACESAAVAERTLLSTRRGAHVLPKFLFGRPLDLWVTPLSSRLPFAVQRRLLAGLVRLARGDQTRYGVPTPPYPLGSEHPTISQDLLREVRAGRIAVKPEVARLEGDRVRFVDGTEEPVDVAIFATGYRVSFPFLDPSVFEVEGNRADLYLHVVPPELAKLYFVGLAQPLGAFPPVAEAQAEWVADLLEGRADLPSPAAMRDAIEARDRARRARFGDSRRHTMEEDFFPYLRAIRRERRKGRRRTRARVPSP